MSDPTAFVVILVTTGSADEAERIGRTLVDERLIACANIIPGVRSIYRWQDAVEDATEHLLILKARAADVAALDVRVRALHSYDVPEVIVLPVTSTSAAYGAWLLGATARGTE